MNRILFILSLFILLSPLKAKSELCPPIFYDIKVENKVTYDRLKYDFSKPLKELKKISQKSGKGHVLGLFSHTLNYKGSGQKIIDGGCVKSITYIAEVDFDPTIYVASNYEKGSKEFDYVFWHENEHAKILIENNKKYLEILEQKIKKYANGIKMTKASNPREASLNGSNIFQKLHNAFMINMKDLSKMIDGLQKDFDEKEAKQGNGKWYLSST